MFSSSPSLLALLALLGPGFLEEMPPYHVQGLLGRLELNLFPLSQEQVLLDLGPSRPSQGGKDQSDRLFWRSSRRSGDAGYGQAKVGPSAPPDARGHGPGDGKADRPVGPAGARRPGQGSTL